MTTQDPISSTYPFGSLLEDKTISTGSGSPFAYGVLEAMYKEDKSVKEMLSVVVKAVDSATNKDTYSCDSSDIAVIDKGLQGTQPCREGALLKS